MTDPFSAPFRGENADSTDKPTGAVDEHAFDAALERFGYAAFRIGQREAIETLLREERLLLVAPTGGGKSLIYQLPAALLPGTSLVISPLISLMADQVAALDQRGVAATFLASTLGADEMRSRMTRVAQGRYDLVYVAPERLSFGGFRSMMARVKCPLIAIDEAHCISEWGHDFRPDYLQIGNLLEEFPDSRVLACTATATPVVRDEIIERLGIPAQTPQLIYGFARPNLALRVREVKQKSERNSAVDAVLRESLHEPGEKRGAVIVYCPTRKASEAEAERLVERGWSCMAYHAGKDGPRREKVHRAFSTGELEVVAATNAFGMGIDRADVRAVIHLAPPGSIEAYYQEVGRAGRDGEAALGLMILSPGDMARRRSLIEMASDGSVPERHVIDHKWGMFLELMRFAEGGSCRHDAVLRYFGDEAETLDGCGRCDVCTSIAAGSDDDEHTDEEVTLLVRKALSAVARVHGRYGLTAAVALLRGVDDARLRRVGLERTTTFGVLRDHSEDWLLRLLRRCVTAGWIDFFGSDRPVVALTESGIAVMRGELPVRLLLPPLHVRSVPASSAFKKSRSGEPGSTAHEELDARQLRVFEALREHRLEVARASGVPPYVVATDRSLREIAMSGPTQPNDLLLVYGIGPAKAEKYGAGLLKVVRDHMGES
ncbi:MAG: ATP-dependent DNA helicase RecQ [Myxococcota bacterium]